VVIGERFAWGHLQKTAGNATLLMFELLPRLIVFADPWEDEEKHSSFAERAEQVEGKLLAANLRRLPSWTLSWAQFRARRGKRPDGTQIQMNSPHQMVAVPRADRLLLRLTADGRYEVDRWLRMEQLTEDFIALVAELTDLTDEERSRIAESPEVHGLDYDHEYANWFTPEQVRHLYENNPVWAKLEERVYGDLALLDE